MRKEILIQALHLFALCSLAIAQPLFDILSRNATFFVANHFQRIDIYVFVLSFCILLPAVLSLLVLSLNFLGNTFTRVLHLCEVAVLVAILALPFAKKVSVLPGAVILVLCAAAGVVYASAYARFRWVQSFTTALSPAVLVVPAYFLFLSPVSKLLFPSATTPGTPQQITSTTPVVMVVFDEFSLASLLDKTHNIDSLRYPNFAELARHSYWFRNVTTVASQTERAVPAILTGLRPKLSTEPLPVLSEYPNNLFTFLGGSYRMKVAESQTFLCPPELGGSLAEDRPFLHRLRSLFSDIRVILLHLLLPKDFTLHLPTIEHTWGGFGGGATITSASDTAAQTQADLQHTVASRMAAYGYLRSELWKSYMNAIGTSDGQTLYFCHILLPHFPWKYTPTGKRYILDEDMSPIPGLTGEDWTGDDWAVLQANQRYLLQVEYVDKLIGQLLSRLKETGLYNNSLVVITADHGVSFRPNDSRRFITDTNLGDILPMPLFIKKPFQQSGVTSDRNVETIDILPTIADVIGAKLPWRVDGQSLFDSSKTDRPLKLVFRRSKTDAYHPYPARLPQLDSAVERNLHLFEHSNATDDLYRIGEFKQLVGKKLSTIPQSKSKDFHVWIDSREYYSSVDKAGIYFQAEMTGNLVGENVPQGVPLAVAVNDTIRSVTRTFFNTDGEFAAMLPESVFHRGHNDVEVLRIDGNAGEIKLIRQQEEVNYTLSSSNAGGFVIHGPGGKSYSGTDAGSGGGLDSIYSGRDYMLLWGWAADVDQGILPEDMIVFVNGRFAYLGDVGNIERKEIAQEHHKQVLLNSGFQFVLTTGWLLGASPDSVRVFALYDNSKAFELPHTSSAKHKAMEVSPADFTLSRESDDREVIQTPGKRSYVVAGKLFDGGVDTIFSTDNTISVYGWAANVGHTLLPDTILIFVGGKCQAALPPGSVQRRELAANYGKPFLVNAGFHGDVTMGSDTTLSTDAVRIFALYSVGMADELAHRGTGMALQVKAPKNNPSANAAQLILSPGIVVRIVPDALQGHLDDWHVRGNIIEADGWAADVTHGEVVESVYVFVDGKRALAIGTGVARKDVAGGYHVPSILGCGFDESFRLAVLGRVTNASRVQFFAVSTKRNIASELRYTYDFPYRH